MNDSLDRLASALSDRYRIERELGAGGMATVYLAHDIKHDRKVAVKVLRPELAAVLGAERFLQEIKVTANLQHPNILALYDSGEAGSFLYYVMPFIEGESLRDKLDRERQLGVDETVEIARSIAAALDYAHRNDVIHRDIKPENILLSDGQALVADFGIALAVSQAGAARLTETGLSLGTPHYMSPEQATGDRELTGRSDIYALGCMAYEMLVGDPPHTGATAQAVIAKVIANEPERITRSRRTVPAHVEAAVHKALEKLPADRFETASEFAAALAIPDTSATAPAQVTETRPVVTQRPRWRFPLGALAVSILAVGVWWMGARSGSGPAAGPGGPSVAVLPFSDPSASGDEQYFGDGVAETLIYALNKVDGLRVAAQTSAFSFRGADVDLAAVGEQLNVGAVLRGNVQRAGIRLRVTVRLESTTDGAQLWSDQYDRQEEDVFAIQDEIARAVVDQLQVTLLGSSEEPLVQPGTENLEAYNLYLRGRYAWAQRGDGLRRGLTLFEQAIELDPFYAKAHAGIADAYSLLGHYGDMHPAEAIPTARAAAERAIALDPSLAEPYATLGFIATFSDWNAEAADTLFRRAIALDPAYAPAHYWYQLPLNLLLGRVDSGLAESQRAVALDPLSPHGVAMLAQGYSMAGLYDDALRTSRRAVELLPSWTNYRQLAWASLYTGRHREALAVVDTALTLSGRHPFVLELAAQTHAVLGDTAAVRAIRDELVNRSEEEYIHPTIIGLAQWLVGDRAAAETWFERALAERDQWLVVSVGFQHFALFVPGLEVPPLGAMWLRLTAEGGR